MKKQSIKEKFDTVTNRAFALAWFVIVICLLIFGCSTDDAEPPCFNTTNVTLNGVSVFSGDLMDFFTNE